MPKSIPRLKKALAVLAGVLGSPLAEGQRAELETVRGLLEEVLAGRLTPFEIRAAAGKPVPPTCRILIAEDNPVNQRVACRLLQELGCKVDISRDGVEALESFDRETYDMIFLDCRMPRLDGYETILEIRRREALTGKKRTPVVAMTAFALKGDRERCINAGMDDYLPKPVMLHDLRKALQTWIPGLAANPLPQPQPGEEDRPPTQDDKPRPPSTLSPERIASLKRRPRGLLRELIGLFLAETPGRVVDLKQAVEERNLEAIEARAHQLKGSSGNLGAEKLAGLCERLELCVRDGNLGRIPLLFADLEGEVGAAIAALVAERDGIDRENPDLR